MVEKFFGGLSDACRKVDPNHLNLGIRYYTMPPHWAVPGMQHFDVFSMNCYRSQVPASEVQEISETLGMPVMIGEWHFGASGCWAACQRDWACEESGRPRRAYRYYLEGAAALPWCVGSSLLHPLR